MTVDDEELDAVTARWLGRVIVHKDRRAQWWGARPHRVVGVSRDDRSGAIEVDIQSVDTPSRIGHVGLDYLDRWEDWHGDDGRSTMSEKDG